MIRILSSPIKNNAILLVSKLRGISFDQSSQVHPVSGFRGGTLSVTEEEDGNPCV